MNVAITENQTRNNKIHPLKFALVVGCASLSMMFVAWTSAYMVRQAAGNWLEFTMPTIFWYSTGILVLSSIMLHFAYRSFKKGKEAAYKGGLLLTFLLGLSFLVMQYQGWMGLYDMGVDLNGNPAGSFVYILSGFHAAHIMAGIGVLTVALIHGFALRFKPSPKRILRLELTLIFWHFLDFLWLYLFAFITLQQS